MAMLFYSKAGPFFVPLVFLLHTLFLRDAWDTSAFALRIVDDRFKAPWYVQDEVALLILI